MNINLQYADIIAPYLEQGLVPALFLDGASSWQYSKVKGFSSGRGLNPKDLLFVPVKTTYTHENIAKTSYVLFANDELQANDVFRRRVIFAKGLSRYNARGEIPKLLGVDFWGNVRPDTYVPIFNVKRVKEADLDDIVAFSNNHLSLYNRGVVRCEQGKNDTGHISFCLRGELASTKDLQNIRKKMFNSIYSQLSEKYDIELLDDRGGNNMDNIKSYLHKPQEYETLAQSVVLRAVECEKTCLGEEKEIKNEQTRD